MRKRIVPVILALCLALAVLPVSAQAAQETGSWGDLTWSFDDGTGTLTVSGQGAIPNGYDDPLPLNYKEWDVKRVVIEDGVTGIGPSAFENYLGLTSVAIPNTVTEIGAQAFSNVDLTSVTLPDNISIGDAAFRGCSLTDVTFLGVVNSIGSFAFFGNDNLTALSFPGTVGEIGDSAFSHCDHLDSVTFSDAVGEIGSSAFYACDALTGLTFSGSCGVIGSAAFSSCDGLTRLELPDGLKEIGSNAFAYCENLIAVGIPGTVERIDKTPFQDCRSLADVYFGGTQAQWLSLGGGKIISETRAAPIPHYGSAQLPDTEAGDAAAFLALIAAAEGAGRTDVRLTDDIELSESLKIPDNSNVILDLNGHSIVSDAQPAVELLGDLTVLDSTASSSPAVTDGKEVNYSSGRIESTSGDAVYVQPGRTFTLKSGWVKSAGDAITVYADRNENTDLREYIETTAHVEGGYVEAEGSAVMALGMGAAANLEGGVLLSRDAPVVSSGEEKREDSVYINVYSATLIGKSHTAGQLACGIYSPQDNSVSIRGAHIYVEDGVGILLRGGRLDIYGKYSKAETRIEAGGSGTGRVGGSTQELPAGHRIVADQKTGYEDSDNISVYLYKEAREYEPCPILKEENELLATETETLSRYFFNPIRDITLVFNNGQPNQVLTTVKGMVPWPADPVREGYEFRGWAIGNDLNRIIDKTHIFRRYSNDKAYAQWIPEGAHTVTFYASGTASISEAVRATGSDGVLTDWPAGHGSGGETFMGWYTGPGEDAEEYPFDHRFTEDSSAYAHYGQPVRPHTVTFDPNDGSGKSSPKTTDMDGKLADWPQGPARDGYRFQGWSWSASYDIMPDRNYEFYEDETLYARWVPNNGFTVTFHPNNGGAAVTKRTDQNGYLAADQRPGGLTLEGYTFGGWYTANRGYTSTSAKFQEDTSLYAYWIENGGEHRPGDPKIFLITFDPNGGTLSSGAATATTSGGRLTALPRATRADHAFEGWFTKKDGGAKVTADTIFDQNTTVFAHWKSGTPDQTAYTVTFNSQGGSTVPAQTVTSGGKAAKPANPARSGYSFDGWFKEAACTTVWDFSSDAVTGDITLYAKWTVNTAPPMPATYTVTFDPNGGSGGGALTTGTDGRLSSLPANPIYTGYTFDGWYSARSGGERIAASTVFRGDTTVYAHWSKIPSVPSTAYYQIYTPGSTYGGSFYVSHDSAAAGALVTVELRPWNNFQLTYLSAIRVDTGWELYLTGRYNNRYTFVMPASDVRLGIAYTPNSSGHTDIEPPVSAKPVNWYYSSGRIYHVTDGLVPLTASLTRDMLVSVLYNMDESSSGDPTAWAAANGIVPDIYANCLWGTDKPISREQTAAILFCYAQHMGRSTSQRANLTGYADSSQIRAAARPAMSWSQAVGLITGTSSSTLSPQAIVNCGQANAILSRFVSNVVGVR